MKTISMLILLSILCINSTSTINGMNKVLSWFSSADISIQLSTLSSAEKRIKRKEAISKILINSVFYNWEQFKKEIIVLIEEDSSLVDTPTYGESGYTPLCYAIEKNDFEFVEYLLERGALLNEDIKGVHSNKLIFFAKNLEMVQYLQDNGADVHVVNKGQGYSGGMNLLHTAFSCNNSDDRLIDHALNNDIDPTSLCDNRGNLWHSLIFCSARYCPEEILMRRARKLHEFGIDPHHKDRRGKSALEYIEEEVRQETSFLEKQTPSELALRHNQFRIEARDKLARLANVIRNKDDIIPEDEDKHKEIAEALNEEKN